MGFGGVQIGQKKQDHDISGVIFALATNVGYSYTISQNVSEVQTGVEQTFEVTLTVSDYTTGGIVKWIIGTSGYLGALQPTQNGTYVQVTTTPSSQKIGIYRVLRIF